MTGTADDLLIIGDAADDAGDFDLARRCFEKGVAAGDAGCLSRLAYLYDIGRGVPTDKRRALRLYLRAWRSRDSVAANNIAILYREKGNVRSMVRWFERAVANGDDEARIELAKLHLRGEGVERSADKALHHLDAALRGNLSQDGRKEAEAMLGAILHSPSARRS